MSAPIGARQDGCFKAVSMAPSFNLTPVGPTMPPLPYPTVSDLSNSIGVARSVRFNGKPVYTMASSQPDCKGDEQGSGGGVRSGTVNGEVKPTSASGTVKVEGKRVVRDGDTCTMNGGNNTGIYTTVPAPSPTPPAMAATTSNPPVKPETPEEKSFLRRWLDELKQEVRQAAAQPLEGLKGAVKGVINIPSNTVELLAKAAVEQHAAELSDAAITASALGQAGTAKSLTELTGASREQVARIDVPKFGMSNQAQQGGDVIAAAVGVFAGGVGLAKAGVKAVAKMGKLEASNSLSKVINPLTLSEQTLKINASTSSSISNNNGVRITGPAVNFNNSALGKTISMHSAIDPGPLDPSVAQTFSGGRYSVIELKENTILHRAGTLDRPLGQFFDVEPPASILQTRIDKAILPVWPGGATSPIDTSFAVSVPKGTLVYTGEVGVQEGFYIGGTQQVVVLKPWAIDGVKIIDSTPLK